MQTEPFWETKTLAEMNQEEWESLCDGCGKCCLHKLEDEDDGEVYYTNVACRQLDLKTARCSDYPNRLSKVPTCLSLTYENLSERPWLPSTCAYKRLAEGKSLAWWHPLISQSTESINKAGVSVAGKVVSELDVNEEDMEDHIILIEEESGHE